VKSGRNGTARFGVLGASGLVSEIAIQPTDAGPAGGVGPTGPFDQERVLVELTPTGEPLLAKVAPSALVFNGFRDTFAQKVLDLSPANDEGWDDLARKAYAAAVHGDPVVASLGAASLAWLAGGLDLKATKLDKTIAPASVVESIGDVEGRLTKRYGALGHLLPLGRASTFRRVLNASPWADAPRVKAAKAAVARLGTLTAVDLASYVMPGIVEDSAPIDPPPAVNEAPKTQGPLPVIAPIPGRHRVRARRWWRWLAEPRRRALATLLAVGIVAAAFAAVRARRRPA
jgi:hypothetical protein